MRIFKGCVLIACATVAVFAMTRTYAFDGTPEDSATAPLGAVTTPSGVAGTAPGLAMVRKKIW